MPAPIGYSSTAAGLANQIRDAVTHLVNTALSMLPTPVTPSALPAVTAPQGQPTYSVGAGKGVTTPDALPKASVTLADSVVVAPAKKVKQPKKADTVTEKTTETTVSKGETATDSPDLAATEDAKPKATDAKATDAKATKGSTDDAKPTSKHATPSDEHSKTEKPKAPSAASA